jgi:ribose transport system permease protein
LNGLLSVGLGIDSFIVTLAMNTIVAGLVLLISGSNTYSGVSQGLVQAVVGYTIFSIPVEFYYTLVAALVLFYVFEFTSIGRRHLYVGRNKDVSRLSGIRVGRIRVGSFIVCSLIAAIAGVMYVGTSGAADPTSGLELLLPAFAAAFLGGTTIVPGQYNPWGTLISAYFLATGITGLEILGAQTYVTSFFYGGALIVAVTAAKMSRAGHVGRLRGWLGRVRSARIDRVAKPPSKPPSRRLET